MAAAERAVFPVAAPNRLPLSFADSMTSFDAVVVGAGPNGLAAAITLAEAGRSVVVLEARETVGGGVRSEELTLPGYIHDVCSSVYPLGIGSPCFRRLPLADCGLEWVHPGVPLAHPLDDGSAAILDRSIETTARSLGVDGPAWHDLVGSFVEQWDRLIPGILDPLSFPRHPLIMARFGRQALRSAHGIARSRFRGTHAASLFAGNAAHSIVPLTRLGTAAIGLVLSIAGHAVGWPFVRGGAQRLARALAAHLESLGGQIRTGVRVDSLQELPKSRAILLDLTPRQILRITGDRLSGRYRRALQSFRYGPGVFKVDYALSGPIPWTAPDCARAGTVHLGGSPAEIIRGESEVWEGRSPVRPFVLLSQPSLFDPIRAPSGKQTAWAYCHVPHGSAEDMTGRIEAQIERFAPGFRELVLARHVLAPAALERRNANLIGGDIGGGAMDFRQLLFRPALRRDPHTTPVKGLYICSSSTPPGGGVHGMCGHLTALAVLRQT